MESSLLGMSLGVVKIITRCMKATKSLILFFIKPIETMHDNYQKYQKQTTTTTTTKSKK